MSSFRIDKDSLGEIKVPYDAYYGPFTVRASNQYNITGQRSHPDLIRAYAMIKKCARSVQLRTRISSSGSFQRNCKGLR